MSQLTIEGLDVRVAERTDWEDTAWGDVGPRFSGRMSSDVTTRHRTFRFVTPELETADKVAIELMLRSPGPLLCSGDMIGAEAAFHVVGPVRIVPVTATDFVLSFVLRESNDLTSDLLFSFDGDAPGPYTHTRSGVARYFDENGVLQTAADGIARFGYLYDPSTGLWSQRGYHGEPARTNVILQSEAFGTTWVNFNSDLTITPNATVAPDGTTTADNLEDNDAANVGRVHQSVTVPDDANPYVFSLCVHKTAHSGDIFRLEIWLTGGSSAVGFIQGDPDDGSIFEGTGAVDSGVEDLGNWWRYWIRVDNNGTGNTDLQARFSPSYAATLSGGADNTLLGDQTVWGALVEVGTVPSSYIPTTTGSAPRNADTLYAPWLHVPQEMTLYLKARELGALATGGTLPYVLIGDGSAARFSIFATASGLEVGHDNGPDVLVAAYINSGLPTIGQDFEVVAHLNADGSVDSVLSVEGGANVTASDPTERTLASAWGAPRANILWDGSSVAGFGAIISVKAVRGIYTMEQMRKIASARAYARAA